MTGAKHLSAVPDPDEDDDAEVAATRGTLETVVKDGAYLDVIKAQQLETARLLDYGAGPQTAQLHRTLIALTKEVREHEDLIGAERTPRPPAEHDTLEAAVLAGGYLDVLKTQQREVARLLDDGAGAQTAQLHRTLTALTKEVRDHEELIGVTRRPRTPDEPFTGAGAS